MHANGIALTALCEECGIPFTPQPRTAGRFCSRPCLHANKRRLATPIGERLFARVEKTDSCWLWTGAINTKGYGWIAADPPRFHHASIETHRVAWTVRVGPIPTGMCVLHTCDVRRCVRNDDEGVYILDGVAYQRFGHLWLGSRPNNSRDMANKGRGRKGPSKGNAKITAVDATAIRRLRADGLGFSQIGEQFNISHHAVRLIVKRKTWKDAP